MAASFVDRKKIVNLLIDKIYIKSGVWYKLQIITGFAENQDDMLAWTVQTLIESGKYIEIVRIVLTS